MNDLIEKINMDFGASNEHFDNERGVVFSARSCTEIHVCKVEYIEEALNAAGYYSEDGDYSRQNLVELSDVVDNYGSAVIAESSECMVKQVWFD